MRLPEKLQIANTPTPIEHLKDLEGTPDHIEIYIKRDDYTGVELSGNKIRKLEFIMKDALDKGEKVVITCGGLQSNHCRATAALAAKLGMKCHLVLGGDGPDCFGNNALDQMFGAEITYINASSFEDYNETMEALKKSYEGSAQRARIIPVGASTPLGTFGYVSAFNEILEQEKTLGIKFDTICVAVGSAGTFAGLWLGNALAGSQKKIVGMNIADRNKDYGKLVASLSRGALEIIGESLENMPEVEIYDYTHTGYGSISDANAAYIHDFARTKGILLDPVYTGKAFYGMLEEIKMDNPHIRGNVLFLHTGGIFGALARKDVYL